MRFLELNWDPRPFLFTLIAPGASDATYHVMWVIVFNAVDDFGINEHNDAARTSSMPNIAPIPSIESVKQKILDEALHGALRIAGLVMPPFFFPFRSLCRRGVLT